MGGVVSVIASTHPDGDLSANTESPPTRPGGRSAAHGGGDVFLHQISRELVNEPRLPGIFLNIRLARVIGEKRSVLFRRCCLLFCFAGVSCRLRHERVRDDVQASSAGTQRAV